MNAATMVNYLIKVSNGNLFVNLLNHVIVIAGLLGCLFLIEKNGKYSFVISQMVVFVLYASLIINAAYYGNPFHIITFVIIAVLCIIFQWKDKAYRQENIETGKKNILNIFSIAFLIFFALGIWYPEFTKVNLIKSVLLSPLGVVPCPTLLCSLSFMNLFRRCFSKKTIWTAITFTIIYGIIGTFVFHVYFDIALLVLAAISIISIMSSKTARMNLRGVK